MRQSEYSNILQHRWLTKRDRDIVLDIYYCKVLNTDHIEQAHFKFTEDGNPINNSRIVALRRLSKLVENNVLKFFWFGYNNQGSKKHFYLGPAGIDIVCGRLQKTKDELVWIPKGLKSYIYLENTIGTNNIRMFFQQKGVKVNKFLVEQLCKINYTRNGVKRYLEPDGLINCTIETNKTFLIEFDRGTMSRSTIMQKIQNYEECYNSDDWIEYFKQFPITLFVVPNKTRLNELIEVFNENVKTDLTFLFTTEELARQNILDKIWHSHKNGQTYKLR